MPAIEASCALCGATVGDERWPLWMREYRTLYAQGRLSTEAYLSGTGLRDILRDTIPPGPIPEGQSVSDDELLDIWLMRTSFDTPEPQLEEAPAWGFPFHESCWQLLAFVRPCETVDVQVLFDIFRSLPVQTGILNFGHDYGGDASYSWHPGSIPVGDEPPLVLRDTYPHQKCDPLELPELRRFLEERCLGGEPSQGVGFYASTRQDPFSKLPGEVLQYIFEYLSSAAVLHLRQSSAACASTPLSQSFWFSRFAPGREFEAIFEARDVLSLKGRWSSLYYLIKSIRKTDPFINRDRVWKLGHSLWDIIDQAASTSLHGDIDQLDSLCWLNAHTALKHNEEAFRRGSRAFHHRTLGIPNGPAHVFVSLFVMAGRSYVSGIRFEGTDGESSVLGYLQSAREALISAPNEIFGFYLAQDERGFRGLAVSFSSGSASEWVGDPRGVPVRKLTLNPTAVHSCVRHIKSSLDAFKIVSLSISDGSPADTSSSESTLSTLDTSLWVPSLPGSDLTVLGMDGHNLLWLDPLLPITLATFGSAPQGLTKICGIAVSVGDPNGELFDIEFRYADGAAPVRVGLDGVMPVNVSLFLIYPEDGEHIRGLECFYFQKGGLAGFKIYTNKGRVGEFSIDTLDELSVGDVYIKSMFPADRTIVGFCSRVGYRMGLEDLGLVCRAGAPGS